MPFIDGQVVPYSVPDAQACLEVLKRLDERTASPEIAEHHEVVGMIRVPHHPKWGRVEKCPHCDRSDIPRTNPRQVTCGRASCTEKQAHTTNMGWKMSRREAGRPKVPSGARKPDPGCPGSTAHHWNLVGHDRYQRQRRRCVDCGRTEIVE